MKCQLCHTEIVGRPETFGPSTNTMFACSDCADLLSRFAAFVLDCEVP